MRYMHAASLMGMVPLILEILLFSLSDLFTQCFFMQNCSECILASTPGEQYTINVHVCIIYM